MVGLQSQYQTASSRHFYPIILDYESYRPIQFCGYLLHARTCSFWLMTTLNQSLLAHKVHILCYRDSLQLYDHISLIVSQNHRQGHKCCRLFVGQVTLQLSPILQVVYRIHLLFDHHSRRNF